MGKGRLGFGPSGVWLAGGFMVVELWGDLGLLTSSIRPSHQERYMTRFPNFRTKFLVPTEFQNPNQMLSKHRTKKNQ
ncbi:hypothetical protein IEQ34_022384 [Dendrobium chrysotoxum]|uniref:Uncharacterized protein n=1 Tax=Dendrobium chrysotoxum TaxID=161865 RepID=A0AAV7FXL4_DENCH|nr:hypothetical protein IEQ34_022384 [Dendrobium chrysotoxum]